MNSTMELVFTVAGAFFVLLNIYGAVKLDRKLFLSGLCFFSFLPIIGESMAYNADKIPTHIIVAMVFVIQFILAFPNSISYNTENTAASKLVVKIALALLVINITGAVFIFCLKAPVPARFGYFHIALSVSILYMIYQRTRGNLLK